MWIFSGVVKKKIGCAVSGFPAGRKLLQREQRHAS